MTTYYRDPEVWITSSAVHMNGQDLPLAALRQVWHHRGPRSWRPAARRGMLALAILAPLAIGGQGIAIGLILNVSAPVTAALVGGGILLGLATVPVADLVLDRVDHSYDRGSHMHQIWARTPTGEILLLSTRDKARFGRVYRALQRALEQPARAPATLAK